MDRHDEAHGFRFADFEFDPDSLELRRHGEVVELQHKPARALALLLASAGDVVLREELRDELWDDDVHIDFDQSLNACIKRLRAALDDDPGDPDYVQTLPRRGYRFVAPVERPAPADPSASPPAAPPPGEAGSPPRSVSPLPRRAVLLSVAAVLALILAAAALVRPTPAIPRMALPPVEAGGDVGDELREAVRDELALALLRRLDGEVALVLDEDGGPDADYVVEGSLVRGPDGPRLALSLVRSATGETVWSDVHAGPAAPAGWRAVAELAAAEVASRLAASSPRPD